MYDPLTLSLVSIKREFVQNRNRQTLGKGSGFIFDHLARAELDSCIQYFVFLRYVLSPTIVTSISLVRNRSVERSQESSRLLK